MLQHRTPIDVLRKTFATAETMARIVAPYATPSLPSPCPIMSTMKLDLPPPESLTYQLTSLGVDEASADRISNVVTRAALKLKDVCEADFDCRRQAPRARYFDDALAASRISATYASIFKTTIQNWKTYIFDNFVPRYMKAQAHYRQSSSRQRRPFNQGALPLLEQYFSHNAFPSRLDKYELAEKSNMDYKQIHVWFQNRRSRFRKEGRELSRSSNNGTLSDELENCIVEALLPVDEGDHRDQGERSELLPDASTKPCSPCPPLKCEAPIHAFPTPYPPLCPVDPFPDTAEKRALQIPWIRSPTSRCNISAVVDIVTLAESFAKMSLAEHQEDISPPCMHSSRSLPLSLSLGFVTPCARAPHPSLVRRPRGPPRSHCTTRAPTCRHRPTICLPSLTLTQPSCTNHSTPPPVKRSNRDVIPRQPLVATEETSRRVKRSLPRRIPRNPPATHAEQTSDTLPLSSSRPSSRTVSTSSLLSRAGSDSDTSETSLSTPPHSPTPLSPFDLPSVFSFHDVVCERPDRQSSFCIDHPFRFPQVETFREVGPSMYFAPDMMKAGGPISLTLTS